MNEFSPFQGVTFISKCNPCELEAKNLCFTSGEQMDVPTSFSDKRVIDSFDIKFLTEINFLSVWEKIVITQGPFSQPTRAYEIFLSSLFACILDWEPHIFS